MQKLSERDFAPINSTPFMKPRSSRIMALMLAFPLDFLITLSSQADEGFWLFNGPPLKQMQKKYHFTPDGDWLEHIQKGSVRFDSGGSARLCPRTVWSSPIIMSGPDALQKFADVQHNYIRDGFYVATRAEEKRCYDLELKHLGVLRGCYRSCQQRRSP